MLLSHPSSSGRDVLFTDIPSGAWQDMTAVPALKDLPPKIDGFVERRFEMHTILSLLNDSRVVSVRGPPGIGKTSIAVQVGRRLTSIS